MRSAERLRVGRDLAAAVPQDAQRGFATVQRELKDLRHLLETNSPAFPGTTSVFVSR